MKPDITLPSIACKHREILGPLRFNFNRNERKAAGLALKYRKLILIAENAQPISRCSILKPALYLPVRWIFN